MFLLFKKNKFGAKSNVREAILLSCDKKTINISDITDRTAVHLHDYFIFKTFNVKED